MTVTMGRLENETLGVAFGFSSGTTTTVSFEVLLVVAAARDGSEAACVTCTIICVLLAAVVGGFDFGFDFEFSRTTTTSVFFLRDGGLVSECSSRVLLLFRDGLLSCGCSVLALALAPVVLVLRDDREV